MKFGIKVVSETFIADRIVQLLGSPKTVAPPQVASSQVSPKNHRDIVQPHSRPSLAVPDPAAFPLAESSSRRRLDGPPAARIVLQSPSKPNFAHYDAVPFAGAITPSSVSPRPRSHWDMLPHRDEVNRSISPTLGSLSASTEIGSSFSSSLFPSQRPAEQVAVPQHVMPVTYLPHPADQSNGGSATFGSQNAFPSGQGGRAPFHIPSSGAPSMNLNVPSFSGALPSPGVHAAPVLASPAGYQHYPSAPMLHQPLPSPSAPPYHIQSPFGP